MEVDGGQPEQKCSCKEAEKQLIYLIDQAVKIVAAKDHQIELMGDSVKAKNHQIERMSGSVTALVNTCGVILEKHDKGTLSIKFIRGPTDRGH